VDNDKGVLALVLFLSCFLRSLLLFLLLLIVWSWDVGMTAFGLWLMSVSLVLSVFSVFSVFSVEPSQLCLPSTVSGIVAAFGLACPETDGDVAELGGGDTASVLAASVVSVLSVCA